MTSCHVLRKDDDDWVKKCMEHEVEGSRPRGRPKKTWKEVVREDCQMEKGDKGSTMIRMGVSSEWVNVSSGTGLPGLSRIKGR